MPKLPELPNSVKAGLVAIVGSGVAIALGVATPMEESGRTVSATIGTQNELVIRHVRGKQYLKPYLDIVGVVTACDGITSYRGRKIVTTDRFSEAQCATMLEEELAVHAIGVMKCSPGLALSPVAGLERRREGPRFAAVSLAYNVGVPTYCKSTGRARFNAGDYAGGCTALTWFNKAGGRVNRGLTGRRAREYAKCSKGLAA